MRNLKSFPALFGSLIAVAVVLFVAFHFFYLFMEDLLLLNLLE